MSFNWGETSIGLDISDRSLKVVRLVKRGKKNTLVYFNDVAVPPGVLETGEIKNEKKIIELLSGLAKKAKIKKTANEPVISVLPETKTFIKLIEIPTTETSEKTKGEQKLFEQLIKEEMVNHIPLNPEEIYLDWQMLSRSPDTTRLLVGAAPKTIAVSYYAMLEKSGLKPQVLEIEAAPIIRSLIKEGDPGSKMIIDFGATRTGLIIYSQQTVNFTVSLPISGENITKTIAETLKIDPTKAEESKIVCGLDKEKCDGALLKVLMEPIDAMASHITKALAYYQANFSKNDGISEIILCGGGANFINIEKVLGEKVGLPVVIGNPLTNIAISKKIILPLEKARTYTTAIGLALNGLQLNR